MHVRIDYRHSFVGCPFRFNFLSLKAAVTLTLLSSASALTSLRLRRELPATNGQLDITDTCDKYQTKEDCCAEVNCQFAAPDKCTKRNAPAENGECPGDRAPPTNSAAANAAFNKRQGSAAGQMIGSANLGNVQVKTAGARSPAHGRSWRRPGGGRLYTPGDGADYPRG